MQEMGPNQLHLMKQAVGKEAAAYVQSGTVIGLGSGSTALQAIVTVGRRLATGDLRDVHGVATSYQTAADAQEAGIPLLDIYQIQEIDLTIDGADEVSPGRCLIKGGGAAHVVEKIVAALADRFIAIVDVTKTSQNTGSLAPVPVAVLPQACKLVSKQLGGLGGRSEVRMANSKLGPVITDNGDMIIDVWFDDIVDPAQLERQINLIPGVVDNGLFVGAADLVLVGDLKNGEPVVYEYEN